MPDQRPNIILIITDQQRFDTIRALGFPYMDTPNLDRFVEEGVSFTNCFITATSCAPSRASLFTGLYPHTTGVLKNADQWRHSWVELLNGAGYHCVNIGKMHTFYGNFNVMVKAYSYIRSMGADNLKKASQLAVLNANYIKERLKQTFHLPYDKPCMHECVFTDKNQAAFKTNTLDIAKRLMDYGFHPPTIYFPLVVNGAMMIEPTETESKEDLDRFIETLKTIAKEAETDPDLLRQAPHYCKVGRLDETAAARNPCLTG